MATITIKQTNGNTQGMESVDVSSTVAEFKVKVEAAMDIPATQLRLIFRGQVRTRAVDLPGLLRCCRHRAARQAATICTQTSLGAFRRAHGPICCVCLCLSCAP